MKGSNFVEKYIFLKRLNQCIGFLILLWGKKQVAVYGNQVDVCRNIGYYGGKILLFSRDIDGSQKVINHPIGF